LFVPSNYDNVSTKWQESGEGSSNKKKERVERATANWTVGFEMMMLMIITGDRAKGLFQRRLVLFTVDRKEAKTLT